jgi:hypothetical protein
MGLKMRFLAFVIIFAISGCSEKCDECTKNDNTKVQENIGLQDKQQNEFAIQSSNRIGRFPDENEEQKNQIRRSNEFLESVSYKKMVSVYVFLDALEKVTNAQESSSQSNHNNESAARSVVVSFNNVKEQAFLDYKKLGGTASNGVELQKRDEDCRMSDWRYAIPYSNLGFITKEQQEFVTVAANCY